MKLYLAGPMTGRADWGMAEFNEATARLKEAGYDVVNPAENGAGDKPWAYYVRLGLKGLLECDGVALLPGWSYSKGAVLEQHVAHTLGMKCKYVEVWIEDAP